MNIQNAIKRYKEWHIEKSEGVQSFNARQDSSIMLFINPRTQERCKRGYVVTLTHKKGGRGHILIKNKKDLAQLIQDITLQK